MIRVIDDAAEAERLCERPAPGADSCVNWDPSMAQCCGKVYVVKRILPVYKGYDIENSADLGADWTFPFDAVSLVTY